MSPRILIPGRGLAAGKASRHEVVFAGTRYLEAVARAGAFGMVVGPAAPLDAAQANALLDQADALLLIGGPDVHPSRYGHQPRPQTYPARPHEDDLEIALVRVALRRNLPLLAICRGIQVLNVALGGTLHQHLPDLAGVGDHAPPAFPAAEPNSIGPLVPVDLDPSSRVAHAMRGPVALGAHSHHQAIDELGAGLRVVGRSADGIVEAVELSDGWAVGVQWHPEDTAATDPAQQGLFDALAERAAARR